MTEYTFHQAVGNGVSLERRLAWQRKPTIQAAETTEILQICKKNVIMKILVRKGTGIGKISKCHCYKQ